MSRHGTSKNRAIDYEKTWDRIEGKLGEDSVMPQAVTPSPSPRRGSVLVPALSALAVLLVAVPSLLWGFGREPSGGTLTPPGLAPPSPTSSEASSDPPGHPQTDLFIPVQLVHPELELVEVGDLRFLGGRLFLTYQATGENTDRVQLVMSSSVLPDWEIRRGPTMHMTEVEVGGRVVELWEWENPRGEIYPSGLRWTEPAGFRVVVLGGNLETSDRLVELAEFIVPMTIDEWTAMQDEFPFHCVSTHDDPDEAAADCVEMDKQYEDWRQASEGSE